MLELYGFARVNQEARCNTGDLRVLWALEEMGLPYENVGMGIPITISMHRRTARCTERPAWKKTVEAYDKRVEPA